MIPPEIVVTIWTATLSVICFLTGMAFGILLMIRKLIKIEEEEDDTETI
jgi:hypothetical protein